MMAWALVAAVRHNGEALFDELTLHLWYAAISHGSFVVSPMEGTGTKMPTAYLSLSKPF
jgi:hypothetical protein